MANCHRHACSRGGEICLFSTASQPLGPIFYEPVGVFSHSSRYDYDYNQRKNEDEHNPQERI